MAVSNGDVSAPAVQPTWKEYFFWILVEWAFLKRFVRGKCEVYLPDGTKKVYGDPDGPTSSLQCEFHIHKWSVFQRVALEESIGLAEAYMAGDWTTPDITAMVSVCIEQDKAGAPVGMPFIKKLVIMFKRVYRFAFRNTAEQSLHNVQAHYDIGNDLYELMLDPTTMGYTCGLWRDFDAPQPYPGYGQFLNKPTRPMEQMTLDQAQINKLNHLIKKGNIQKHHKVLELGCGWGGFSCHLAKTVGCKIDAYNLSVEQIKMAKERAKKAGVDHLINYVHDDYRHCVNYITDAKTGKLRKRTEEEKANHVAEYDACVSIGMLEHVGHYDLPNFFRTCEKQLQDNGIICLHTITSNEHGYEIQKHEWGFIQKYIFPGAVIPAVGAIVDAAVWNTRWELQHFENIGEHYAPTLRAWRENFYRNIEKIKELKDEKGNRKYASKEFLRMWDFYLCNCEAEFLTGHFGLGHFIWKKPSTAFRSQERQNEIMPQVKSLTVADCESKGGKKD